MRAMQTGMKSTQRIALMMMKIGAQIMTTMKTEQLGEMQVIKELTIITTIITVIIIIVITAEMKMETFAGSMLTANVNLVVIAKKCTQKSASNGWSSDFVTGETTVSWYTHNCVKIS